jgi:hypothetical protein
MAKAVYIFIYRFITDPTLLYAAVILDGIVKAFASTAIPALLAVTVDRKVIGSGYAIMMGVSNLITSNARSVGISIYENHGIGAVTLIASGIALLGAVFCLLLDSGVLINKVEQEQIKGNRSYGICWRMLPLCIVAAIPIAMYLGETNYLQLYAAEEGFDYLKVYTIAAAIDGINTVLVGFLCDIIPSSFFVLYGLAGAAIGAFLFANAHNSTMFQIGILVYYCTQIYDPAIRITGMRAVALNEQGSFQATVAMCNEILSTILNPIFGWLVASKGYRYLWNVIAAFVVVAFISFLILRMTILPKMDEERNSKSKEPSV